MKSGLEQGPADVACPAGGLAEAAVPSILPRWDKCQQSPRVALGVFLGAVHGLQQQGAAGQEAACTLLPAARALFVGLCLVPALADARAWSESWGA